MCLCVHACEHASVSRCACWEAIGQAYLHLPKYFLPLSVSISQRFYLTAFPSHSVSVSQRFHRTSPIFARHNQTQDEVNPGPLCSLHWVFICGKLPFCRKTRTQGWTIYIWCIYGVFGRETTKYMVIWCKDTVLANSANIRSYTMANL